MMSDQLWELLIKIRQVQSDQKLTCTECFAIIELLVIGAQLGIERYRLERMARDHLAYCPDCQEQIWERLGQLTVFD